MKTYSVKRCGRVNLCLLVVLSVFVSLTGCSSNSVIVDETLGSTLSSYTNAQFVDGMQGAENLYIDSSSNEIRVYVSDLAGTLYLIEGNDINTLKVTKKLKIASAAFGIAEGLDGYLYVAASSHHVDDVPKKGGNLYRVSKDLKSHEKVSKSIPGVNGVARDKSGDIYLASGNLSLLFPAGKVYKFPYDKERQQYGDAEVLLDDIGSANGLIYSEHHESLLLSQTFSSVGAIDLARKTYQPIFEKSRIIDAFDDLCVDQKGRIWVAEPLGGFIKVYDTSTKELKRFSIDGMGVGSSCGIIYKGGKEYLLVTEREIDKDNDGRGLLILSMEALENGSKENETHLFKIN